MPHGTASPASTQRQKTSPGGRAACRGQGKRALLQHSPRHSSGPVPSTGNRRQQPPKSHGMGQGTPGASLVRGMGALGAFS